MIEVPSHYGWTAQQFEGMDSWEVQAHIKADMVMTEVYVEPCWQGGFFFSSRSEVSVGRLKIPKEKQAAFKQTYEISEGHWSLEWCHPSPMPFHTYTDGAHVSRDLARSAVLLTCLLPSVAHHQGDWREALKYKSPVFIHFSNGRRGPRQEAAHLRGSSRGQGIDSRSQGSSSSGSRWRDSC